MAEQDPVSLDDVKRLILALPRADREMIRPWILARMDVRGYILDGGVRLPHDDELPAPERKE